MTFFRPRVRWNRELRWYEAAALLAWSAGQVICGICVLVAIWLLARNGFDRDEQIAAAAVLLTGATAMVLGRALLAMATRRRRWHRLTMTY